VLSCTGEGGREGERQAGKTGSLLTKELKHVTLLLLTVSFMVHHPHLCIALGCRYVEDLKEFYGKTRISVAPLRWGAGVKGKINSAMK
jgi:hypothetical protein